ncbi:hypothetical protein BL250_05505 [Erwinia sp. OLTSP20]|uniref:hypothetical protein n=1 Tax=unclassified Erwinia TaxID=2622719 RepID=UPI000C178BFF|nr:MULTISPECIES: hypothetical protein [unclassified Erwinia]PIJ51459.1 hypothetical protein BV501_04340 [Erwinia sp. OAMSP11]PIJ73481.1 hypothetical protein BK416_07175 [Erwinia sp. OLSSP12]PIJ85544.1 hypothetical protein BLD47_00325 [Erwinia sp. OLCASP19]PIJ85942.1 hypothetical protein BLD46_05370 [Erwinia sp. OLMTSP26]PIJ87423.1 hypothetical protein BLD49_06395 [Erwinia sp. OLMDSP33]
MDKYPINKGLRRAIRHWADKIQTKNAREMHAHLKAKIKPLIHSGAFSFVTLYNILPFSNKPTPDGKPYLTIGRLLYRGMAGIQRTGHLNPLSDRKLFI